MHIRINDFLINENIKQMRQYLVKHNIEDLEPSLDFIKDKFKGKPNYIYIFTKIMVDEDGTIHGTKEQFDGVADWIINKNHLVTNLPKKVSEYTSIEELQDDINKVNLSVMSQKFYSTLYSNMRTQIENLNEEERTEMDNVVIAFVSLGEDSKKSFPPLAYFEKNKLSVNDLKLAMSNFIKCGSVNSSKEGVLSTIEGNKEAIIMYDKDNTLVIQTNNRELILQLGSQRWCIVYAPDSYFDGYVGGANLYAQFICFNFNLPQSNKYSIFGISLTMDGKAVRGGCQDRENAPLLLDDVCEHLDIPLDIRKDVFTNPYKEIVDYISKQEDIPKAITELEKKLDAATIKAVIQTPEISRAMRMAIKNTLLNSDDIAISILKLKKSYGINLVEPIYDTDEIRDLIIKQMASWLSNKSPDLFNDGFNLYDYLTNISDKLDTDDSDPHALHIFLLKCYYDAVLYIGLGEEDFIKYINTVSDKSIMDSFLEEYIPEEYYAHPDKYEDYANLVIKFNLEGHIDETAFDYIMYENTQKETPLNIKHKEKLDKALDLDENNYSELTFFKWSNLESYFEDSLDFLEDGYSDDYYGDFSWDDNMDFSLSTLLAFYENLQECDDLELEHYDIYKKYKDSEYSKYGYDKTYELMRNDESTKDIRILDGYIIDIINDPEEYGCVDEVETIRDAIRDAANSAYSDAIYTEKYKTFVNVLDDVFEYQTTKDGEQVIYTRNDNDHIVLKFNTLEYLTKDKNNLEDVVNYTGESFSAEDVLDRYMDERGTLSINFDGYASIDDDNFNDRIGDYL